MQRNPTTLPSLTDEQRLLLRINAFRLFKALEGLSRGHIGGVMCWCEVRVGGTDPNKGRRYDDPEWVHDAPCIAAREAYLAAGGAA